MQLALQINHSTIDFQQADWEQMVRVSLKDHPEQEGFVSFLKEWLSDSDFITAHSSGSTGEPKPIQLKKEWMKRSAELTRDFFQIPSGSVALIKLPISFIAGKMMVVRAIENNWHLITATPNSLADWENSDITFAAFTPMQVDSFLQENKEKYQKIERVIIGGGKTSDALWHVLSTCSNSNYLTYGMTETCTHVAVQEVSSKNQNGFFKALAGVRFSMDDRSCLAIEAKHLDDHIIQTNDLVELQSEQSFNLIGRADRIINSGGRKIFPERLEDLFQDQWNTPFYFCDRADEKLGSQLVLVLQEREGLLLEKIQTDIEEKLEKYDRPKEICIKKQLKCTHTGKLIKKWFDNE
jgi:O-succinylbenzoic acid--CoA ligase